MELRRLREIARLLDGDEPVVVVQALTRQGSVPTPVAALMIVHEDGIIGTVGGGILEADAIAEARAILGSGHYRLMARAMDGSGDGDDMLCGGSVTLLLEGIPPSEAEIWRAAERAVAEGVPVVWHTRIAGGKLPGLVRELIRARSSEAENSPVVTARESGVPVVIETEQGLSVYDPVVISDTLLLFGAGHVAQALAPIATAVGFRCIIVDDRADFACRARFPTAETLVVRDPADAVASLPSGERVWAAIMTRGHKDDEAVLARIVRRPYRYVGMVGSSRKKAALWEHLMAQGVPSAALEAVHCPIGLAIGGTSPQEIAVSIAAELVAVRHGRCETPRGTSAPDHTCR